MIGLFRIHGDSMSPSLFAGDYVVTWRTKPGRLRAGQAVVVDHPSLGLIVKRIQTLLADGRLQLSGDNPRMSTATEVIGTIHASRVLGTMMWRIPIPGGQKKYPE